MADIADYLDGLSLIARQTNEQVRALLTHPGEKGRAAEHIVRSITRAILPKKFSIGSGFIVTSEGGKSPQLDIVLFDEQVNAPLTLIGDIGVFPIECVYGVIEVKSRLTRETLEQAASAIQKIRRFRAAKYYRGSLKAAIAKGKLISQSTQFQHNLSPRTYIFAFDTSFRSIAKLQAAIEEMSDQYQAFFHGVVVLNKDWFVKQIFTKKAAPKKFQNISQSAVREFALKLSKDTISYPMYPADMGRYLGPTEEDTEPLF